VQVATMWVSSLTASVVRALNRVGGRAELVFKS